MEALGGDEEAEALLGVAYAARQCDELLAGGAPGIHFYALNRAPGVRAVLERAARLAAVGARRGRRRRLHRIRADGTARGLLPTTQATASPTTIYGEGEHVIVLVHGLLMNRRMYERLGPELAARGNRVVVRRPARPRPLRPPGRPAPLQHDRLRRAGRRRCSTTSSSRRP